VINAEVPADAGEQAPAPGAGGIWSYGFRF
jgi:hypothetical protein